MRRIWRCSDRSTCCVGDQLKPSHRSKLPVGYQMRLISVYRAKKIVDRQWHYFDHDHGQSGKTLHTFHTVAFNGTPCTFIDVKDCALVVLYDQAIMVSNMSALSDLSCLGRCLTCGRPRHRASSCLHLVAQDAAEMTRQTAPDRDIVVLELMLCLTMGDHACIYDRS